MSKMCRFPREMHRCILTGKRVRQNAKKRERDSCGPLRSAPWRAESKQATDGHACSSRRRPSHNGTSAPRATRLPPWCPAARQSPWCAAARQPPPSVVRSRKAAASLRHCASATRQQRSANTAHVRFSKIAPWEARLAGGGRKPQAKTVRNANFTSKARRKALRAAGQQECGANATAAADESAADESTADAVLAELAHGTERQVFARLARHDQGGQGGR